jgi:hypothetical protein
MSEDNEMPDLRTLQTVMVIRHLEARKVQLESERFEIETRLDEVVRLIKKNAGYLCEKKEEDSCYKNKKLIKVDDEEVSCFCRKCASELLEELKDG